MNKRKNSDNSESKERKKIIRLEKRLARYKEKEKRSKDENEEEVVVNTIQTESTSIQPQEGITEGIDLYDVEVISNPGSLGEEELDTDFLSALGDLSNGDKQYGDKIHEEIFNIIKNTLIEGLPKQSKDKLIESLLIPINCKLLEAPKLNFELTSLLSNPSKAKDKLLQERQQELGVAIASICQIMHSLSKKDYDKLNIIKKLSDVIRILSNMHFNYTEIRRKLINPSLDRNLAESLKENKRETYLYSNLEDSVKSFSAMRRASSVLKPKPAVQTKPTSSKNYQQPPRRSHLNQAQAGRGSLRGGAQNRYQPQPRPPFKQQDNRQSSNRRRAKYP